MGNGNSLQSGTPGVRFLVEIGQGSFGKVYKAEWNGEIVAAKQLLPHLFRNDDIINRFRRECQTLRGLDHANIVKMFEVIEPAAGEMPPILITELLHCDLQTYIQKSKPIPLRKVVKMTLDVAEGLRYLQSRRYPIAHRDLASKNILLTINEQAKIADLGLARVFVSDTAASPIPGTPLYAAPETFPSNTTPSGANPAYDVRVDVFSFGVLLLEVITGWLPRPDPLMSPVTPEGELVPEHHRRRKDISEMGQEHCLAGLVLQSLENDRAARPTTQEIVDKLDEQKEKIERKVKIASEGHAKLKILALGASGVGKTCVLKRFVHGPQFDVQSEVPTIGSSVFFHTITHNGINFTLRMDDTAGQEKHRGSITPSLFRDLDAVLFIFGIDKISTLEEEIPYFIQLLAGHSRCDFLSAVLVGNKSDATRKVTEEKAQRFARKYSMPYIETSAKTGQNIERLFEQVVQMVYDRLDLGDIEIYFPSRVPSETSSWACCNY